MITPSPGLSESMTATAVTARPFQSLRIWRYLPPSTATAYGQLLWPLRSRPAGCADCGLHIFRSAHRHVMTEHVCLPCSQVGVRGISEGGILGEKSGFPYGISAYKSLYVQRLWFVLPWLTHRHTHTHTYTQTARQTDSFWLVILTA